MEPTQDRSRAEDEPVQDHLRLPGAEEEKQGVLMGKETRRKLATGDHVRVRITAVSLGRGGTSGKVGVTARQPFLGKLEWIKQDVERIKSGVTEKPKRAAPAARAAKHSAA